MQKPILSNLLKKNIKTATKIIKIMQFKSKHMLKQFENENKNLYEEKSN